MFLGPFIYGRPHSLSNRMREGGRGCWDAVSGGGNGMYERGDSCDPLRVGVVTGTRLSLPKALGVFGPSK